MVAERSLPGTTRFSATVESVKKVASQMRGHFFVSARDASVGLVVVSCSCGPNIWRDLVCFAPLAPHLGTPAASTLVAGPGTAPSTGTMSGVSGLREIAVYVLPDGRALFSLRNRSSGLLDLRASRIDDTDRISGFAQEWAARDWNQAQPNPELTELWRAPQTREFHEAMVVVVSARGTSPELSPHHRTLADYFVQIFGDVYLGKAPRELPVPDKVVRNFVALLPIALQVVYERSRRQAQWRAAEGRYLPVLTSYLATLRAPVRPEEQNFYSTHEHTLIAMLRSERYLLLSADGAIRRAYLDIIAEISSLYNWYMDLAKGGHSRAR